MLQTGVNRGGFHPIQPLEAIYSFCVNVTDGLILQASISGKEGNFYLNEQLEGLKMYLRTVLQVENKLEGE